MILDIRNIRIIPVCVCHSFEYVTMLTVNADSRAGTLFVMGCLIKFKGANQLFVLSRRLYDPLDPIAHLIHRVSYDPLDALYPLA